MARLVQSGSNTLTRQHMQKPMASIAYWSLMDTTPITTSLSCNMPENTWSLLFVILHTARTYIKVLMSWFSLCWNIILDRNMMLGSRQPASPSTKTTSWEYYLKPMFLLSCQSMSRHFLKNRCPSVQPFHDHTWNACNQQGHLCWGTLACHHQIHT